MMHKITKRIFMVIISILIAGFIGASIFILWLMAVFGAFNSFLLPNPPKPEIKYGEFNFRLEYEISGERNMIEDTLVCEFDGFRATYSEKYYNWKEHLKNENNNELFAFKQDDPTMHERQLRALRYDQIVLKNIGNYKILLGVSDARYFLGDPEYKGGTHENPYINVYDTNIHYYIDTQEFLDEHDFKIIDWYCDAPIQNTFK